MEGTSNPRATVCRSLPSDPDKGVCGRTELRVTCHAVASLVAGDAVESCYQAGCRARRVVENVQRRGTH